MLQCVDGFTNEFKLQIVTSLHVVINAHIGIYEFKVKKHYTTKPRQNRGDVLVHVSVCRPLRKRV